MGKGSGRRPTEISEEEFQNNFDRIFRGPQPEASVACPAIHTTDGGHRVRCHRIGEHLAHSAGFDGEVITWIDEQTSAAMVRKATTGRFVTGG